VSFSTWTPRAVSSEARPWRGAVWRMVEAQHVASTMKLVDTGAEHDLLEALLESVKPPMPTEAEQLDYLLVTPFRYDPLRDGSRFRGPNDPGVFYGAETVRTAAAELGFWRWKFLADSAGLERLEPVAHTAFRVDISAATVDLRRPPFDRDEAHWRHPSDYAATQAFARTARTAEIGAICYRSVRDVEPAWCLALLTPAGFARPKPQPRMQTWFLAVSRVGVSWRRERKGWEFSAAGW